MNELISKHSDLSNSIIKRAKVTFSLLKTVHRTLNWILWHFVFWDIWHIWETLCKETSFCSDWQRNNSLSEGFCHRSSDVWACHFSVAARGWAVLEGDANGIYKVVLHITWIQYFNLKKSNFKFYSIFF